MRGFVVYESHFGNTARIAQAVADGLKELLDVELHNVAEGKLPEGADLLVMGGPTHAFSMSRATTRQDAVNQGAKADPTIGLREWLESCPRDMTHRLRRSTRASKWCADCPGQRRRPQRRWPASADINRSRGQRASMSRTRRGHYSTVRCSAPRFGALSSQSPSSERCETGVKFTHFAVARNTLPSQSGVRDRFLAFLGPSAAFATIPEANSPTIAQPMLSVSR